MNKVILMGRLTRDPEIRGESDKKVARYSLAVDRRFSKDEATDFINIVCFGKSADFAEKYFHKGMKVLVTGRIRTGSYENKEGQKVYTFDIIAEDQEFCESKTSQEESKQSKSSDGDFMDIPKSSLDDMPF